MRNVIVVGVLAALSVVPAAPASAAVAPKAPSAAAVEVEVVTVNGSGCPGGTGTAVISDELDLLTVTGPVYFASAGGGARPTDFRKNCQFSVQIDKPAGWTYAVTQVTSRGYAALSAGATGLSRVALYFQGTTPTTTVERTFEGPLVDQWQTTDAVDPGALNFAPCGTERNLNINTEVRVGVGTSSGTTSSFMIRDATSTYRLGWRRCPAA